MTVQTKQPEPTTNIAGSALNEFEDALRGELIRRHDNDDDSEYDRARTVWNGMIDKHPALIARCTGAADVMEAVNFARDHDLLLAVRGGGHNVAGNAVCDGGLVIDLSALRSVRVDPERQTARVEPGATMADLDHETQAFGLATPAGFNSTTGVAGLTLGGGFGWLSRKYGMTIDNLRAVDIVTADGQLRHASATENPELFWGVRGGGGNFGVVTSFEFDLHQVGPEVLAGLIAYPMADAPEVLRHWRDFVADIPDELTVWVITLTAPPFPFMPEEYHGTKIVAVVPVYVGDMAAGQAQIAPLRSFGDPIADVVEPRRYKAWQQFFDVAYTPGARNYWKSHNLTAFTDETIDTLLTYAQSTPSPAMKLACVHFGGAATRVPVTATAYPHRNAEFIINIVARWEDPAQDDACVAWARDCYDALAEFATGGTYVNFISEEMGEEDAAYRENFKRLVSLKNQVDPTNLFRMNQNIQPTG